MTPEEMLHRERRRADLAERFGDVEADGLIESMYPETTRRTLGRMETMLLRLDPQLRADLRARAVAEDRTQATVVRRALRWYFENTRPDGSLITGGAR